MLQQSQELLVAPGLTRAPGREWEGRHESEPQVGFCRQANNSNKIAAKRQPSQSEQLLCAKF